MSWRSPSPDAARTAWQRWLAYTQSTSLCRYLIERYGKERFVKLYDAPFERIDFAGLYGRGAEALIDEWLREVTRPSAEDAQARAVFAEMRQSLLRR